MAEPANAEASAPTRADSIAVTDGDAETLLFDALLPMEQRRNHSDQADEATVDDEANAVDDLAARQAAEHDVLGTRSVALTAAAPSFQAPPSLFHNLPSSRSSTETSNKHSHPRLSSHNQEYASTNFMTHPDQCNEIQFHQVMQQLPQASRQAYEQALRLNPRIVQRETPIHRFLAHSRGDTLLAAQTLVKYWSKRQSTFGEDRYHEPLSLDGRGAMHPEAAAALKNGVCAITEATDQAGRVVWVIDGKFRNEYCCLSMWRAQIVFYMLQALSEHEMAVRNGFVLLGCSDQQEDPSEDDDDDDWYFDDSDDDDDSIDHGERHNKYTLDEEEQYTRIRPAIHPERSGFSLLTSGAFPVQIKGIHYVHPIQKDAPTRLTQFISSLWNVFIKTFFAFLNLRYRVHSPRSVKELSQSLTGFGFLPQHHFPRRWGGQVDGQLWYLLRLEKDLSSRKKDEQAMNESPQSSTHDEAPIPEQRDAFLKRKMDEFHDHNQIQFLKYELKKLQATKKSLQQDEQLLRAQWHYAQEFARKYESDLEMIQERLQGELQQLFSRRGQSLNHPRELQSLDALTSSVPKLSHQITTQSLVFHGRNCFTGKWEFQKNSEYHGSPEPHAEYLASSLAYLKGRMESWDPLEMEFQHRQKRLKQESSTSSVPSDSKRNGDNFDKDDAMFRSLQEQVTRLQAEKSFLERDEKLIHSVSFCAHQIIRDYHAFCEEHRPALARAVAEIFSQRSGLPMWMLTPFDFGKVADRVFLQFIFVSKEQMRSSFGELARFKLEELLQRIGHDNFLLFPSWITTTPSSISNTGSDSRNTRASSAATAAVSSIRSQSTSVDEEGKAETTGTPLEDRKMPGKPSRGSRKRSQRTSSTVEERQRQVFQRRKNHLKRL